MPALTMIRQDDNVIGDNLSALAQLQPERVTTKEEALAWWQRRVQEVTQRQENIAMAFTSVFSLFAWLWIGLSLSGPQLLIILGCLIGTGVTALALSALVAVIVESNRPLQRRAARQAVSAVTPQMLLRTWVETTDEITLRLVSSDPEILTQFSVQPDIQPGARIPEITLLKKIYSFDDESQAHETIVAWEEFCRSFNQAATTAYIHQYHLPNTPAEAVAFQRALQQAATFETKQAKLARKERKGQRSIEGVHSDHQSVQARLEDTQQSLDDSR